jgi:hypothetical protein
MALSRRISRAAFSEEILSSVTVTTFRLNLKIYLPRSFGE